jgi:tyrosyl-tRNA synthetase
MEKKRESGRGPGDLIDRLARTTDEVFSLDELRSRLASGKKLKIKFGADVTAPFLHLGHAVNLRMMRAFQEEGHRVQFLIGDFTTLIGDPTGKSEGRPVPSREEIDRNAREFVRQVGKVLIADDPELFEVRRNSEWYGRMGAGELLGLLGEITLARLSSRDMFRRRIEAGVDIRMNELCYPVLQGWDSVMLESDLTIVGSDQLFNEMMGRVFQERRGQRPQVVMTSKITPGLDGGQKQSKSLGNYIALDDPPRQKFGKAMGLPDGLIAQWMEVYTDIPMERVAETAAGLASGKIAARAAKAELARAIVELHHGKEVAAEESEWFESTFAKREFPADAPLLKVKPGEALGEIVAAAKGVSLSEARRIISQGGVELDGQRLQDPALLPALNGSKLKIGKRGFYTLVP